MNEESRIKEEAIQDKIGKFEEMMKKIDKLE